MPCPHHTVNTCICLSLCALANSSVQDISTALAEQYWLHKRCDPNGSAREKITFQNYDTVEKHKQTNMSWKHWMVVWALTFLLRLSLFIFYSVCFCCQKWNISISLCHQSLQTASFVFLTICRCHNFSQNTNNYCQSHSSGLTHPSLFNTELWCSMQAKKKLFSFRNVYLRLQ